MGNPERTTQVSVPDEAYLRMIRDGIRFAEGELFGEVNALLRMALEITPDEVAEILRGWDQEGIGSGFAAPGIGGESSGLARSAQQMVKSGLEMGVAVSVVGAALLARRWSQVEDGTKLFGGPLGQAATRDRADFIEVVRRALLCSRIICHVQGFLLLQEKARAHGWEMELDQIAHIWREEKMWNWTLLRIEEGHEKQAPLLSLFAAELSECQAAWRKAVVKAIALGLAVPCLSSALAFYDGYRHRMTESEGRATDCDQG